MLMMLLACMVYVSLFEAVVYFISLLDFLMRRYVPFVFFILC